MPVKGMQQVRANARKFTERAEAITEKTLFMIGAVIISNSKPYVPLDTGNLQNSDFKQVFEDREGLWTLTVGFTADYALPLHGNDTYSPIWRPRPVGTKVYDQGKGRGARIKTAANMEATPQFLSRGVDDSIEQIQQVIESEYRKA